MLKTENQCFTCILATWQKGQHRVQPPTSHKPTPLLGWRLIIVPRSQGPDPLSFQRASDRCLKEPCIASGLHLRPQWTIASSLGHSLLARVVLPTTSYDGGGRIARHPTASDPLAHIILSTHKRISGWMDGNLWMKEMSRFSLGWTTIMHKERLTKKS